MEKKGNRILTRDESFNFRAAFWSDLHSLLYEALPSETVLWGQTFLSFCVSNGGNRVTVKAKSSQSGEITEVAGDLLVAADGCLSSIRQSFFPEHKLRFVDDFSCWKFVDFVLSTKLQIQLGTQVIVRGEGSLIFQTMRIQTLFLDSRKLSLTSGNAYISTWERKLTPCFTS